MITGVATHTVGRISYVITINKILKHTAASQSAPRHSMWTEIVADILELINDHDKYCFTAVIVANCTIVMAGSLMIRLHHPLFEPDQGR